MMNYSRQLKITNVLSTEAKRRQLQFIGKLMRSADTDAIQQTLDLQNSGSNLAKKQFHKLEFWRDRMINEGDSALTEAINEFPEIDRHQARQLIRQAQKELSQQKPPAASRKLFKYLKDLSKVGI